MRACVRACVRVFARARVCVCFSDNYEVRVFVYIYMIKIVYLNEHSVDEFVINVHYYNSDDADDTA